MQFQDKEIKPDVMIFEQGGGHVIRCLKDHGTVQYLIEIKRADKLIEENELYNDDDNDFSNKTISRPSKR